MQARFGIDDRAPPDEDVLHAALLAQPQVREVGVVGVGGQVSAPGRQLAQGREARHVLDQHRVVFGA